MKNMTQHTTSLELAARIDEFRKQFPADWPRLLEEYAELESTGSRDDLIEEIEAERDCAIGEKEDLRSDLDTVEGERDAALSDLSDAERRIEELEHRIESLEK